MCPPGVPIVQAEEAFAFCFQTARDVYEILTLISTAQPLPPKMMSQVDIPEQTEAGSVDTTETQTQQGVSPRVAHWKRELKISKRYGLEIIQNKINTS